MKREYIGTGKTVDEAIEAACAALGCERSEIEFEILALAKKSFFGLRTTPAQVKVTWEDGTPEPRANRPQEGRREKKAEKPAEKPAEKKPEPRAEKPKNEPKPEKPRAEKPAEKKPEIEPMRPLPELSDEIPEAVKPKAELAAAYLTEVIRAMEVKDFTITPKMREDTLVLLIEGSDLGVVIGRRGETLDSLQVLTGLAANRGEGEYVRVNLDSGNFREKRTKTLEELAVKMAKNAVRTGRSTTLEPMNPYDRRIIHAAVAGVEGAASTSIGEEPNRRVVISSLNPRKPQQDRRGGHGGRGRRGGRGGDRRRDSRPVENAAVNAEKPAAPKAPLKEAEDKPLYGKIEL
ncbi:MAG: Jag N-terminal domain-containing protein [Clostridiales bacterium]|nr:Jag N-terminal domain-containing protein [Clostridiales bacterium]